MRESQTFRRSKPSPSCRYSSPFLDFSECLSVCLSLSLSERSRRVLILFNGSESWKSGNLKIGGAGFLQFKMVVDLLELD